MKVNGEGIYNSKPRRPYASGNNVFLTQSKDGAATYAFYMDVSLPAEVSIDGLNVPVKSKVTLLGHKGLLKWRQEGKKLIILIPAALQDQVTGQHAVAFKIS
jgi:hypothetical protein